MSKPNRPSPKPRTSLPLGRTHSRITALLDFPAGLALQYSQAQARHIGGLSVPASVIVRRALFVYALHIQQQARDDEAGSKLTEWRAVRIAAEGRQLDAQLHTLTTEEEAQAQALKRIQALAVVPKGQPLPDFLEALHGPEMVALRDAQHAERERSVAALLVSISKTPRGRLTGLGKTLAAEAARA